MSQYTLESVKAKSKLCSTPMGVLEAYCMSLEDNTPQQYGPHMEQQVWLIYHQLKGLQL